LRLTRHLVAFVHTTEAFHPISLKLPINYHLPIRLGWAYPIYCYTQKLLHSLIVYHSSSRHNQLRKFIQPTHNSLPCL
jgi:hypothetical protein